tara:strand:- start:954 stop:1205 length:252 start_codon:yes stop_codon:yes gene_type:complete
MNPREKSTSINENNDPLKDDSSNLIIEKEIDKENIEETENYNFGWSQYSEITNGRFAMIGFAAIILIELISKKSFLNWAGIFN